MFLLMYAVMLLQILSFKIYTIHFRGVYPLGCSIPCISDEYEYEYMVMII